MCKKVLVLFFIVIYSLFQWFRGLACVIHTFICHLSGWSSNSHSRDDGGFSCRGGFSFSFLDTWKPIFFHTSHLKLNGASTFPQTLSLGSPLPLAASATFTQMRISKQSTKDDGQTRVSGDCGSHVPLLCFATAEKVHLCSENLSVWNGHMSAVTSRHLSLWCR